MAENSQNKMSRISLTHQLHEFSRTTASEASDEVMPIVKYYASITRK